VRPNCSFPLGGGLERARKTEPEELKERMGQLEGKLAELEKW